MGLLSLGHLEEEIAETVALNLMSKNCPIISVFDLNLVDAVVERRGCGNLCRKVPSMEHRFAHIDLGLEP